MGIPAEIKTICEEVAKTLNKVEFFGAKQKNEDCPKIIFPKKDQQHDDNIMRVSEQEARVLFIHALETSKGRYFYSIETPTENKYIFKNGEQKRIDPKGKSARSDLSLYTAENKGFKKILNIEFKHKNCPPDHILKDMVKFYGEPIPSLWFHILSSEDSVTFKRLMQKFKPMLELLKKPNSSGPRICYFFFCTLGKYPIRQAEFDIFDKATVSSFLEQKAWL